MSSYKREEGIVEKQRDKLNALKDEFEGNMRGVTEKVEGQILNQFTMSFRKLKVVFHFRCQDSSFEYQSQRNSSHEGHQKSSRYFITFNWGVIFKSLESLK